MQLGRDYQRRVAVLMTSVMDRRAFLGTLAGSVLSAPLTARAQQPRSVWRLGFLAPGLSQDTSRSAVLMQTLQELGYVQNQSLLVEHRFAEGKIERLPAMAAELVQLKVDVLFTVSTPGSGQLRVRRPPSPLSLSVSPIRSDPEWF
jgi:putative tryptophan/tyrosine transport system substrate-binding protein